MTSGRAIPSRGSCDVQTDPLDGFDFRADGFFLDAFGAPCVLLGTVEFTDFWNAFDACFSSPMGRKLIYAATDAEEDILRGTLTVAAVNSDQPLYVSELLPQTGRVMVKDENVCVHCSLCAERCPTGAWDMRKSKLLIPYATDEETARCQRKTV